ncbi:MAG: O-antigen acetylase [Frankiales bacterium]|nr:O-antigen acetylase [Frankiales bacterium]
MSRFRSDVEGLRAVAVLLVLGDHLFGRPAGGFVGVDVFFVVSGFLITGLLAREAQRTGRVRLRAFWLRRVRRLLPTALVVLAVTCVAASALFLPVRAAQTARDAVWAAFSAANWRFASLGTDYFSQTRPPSPVQQYWSLAVEEQFYLVWPLVVLLLATRSARVLRARLTLAAGVVLVASVAWSVHVTAAHPAAAYFSTPARAYELAAGALLALHVGRAEALRVRTAHLLSLLGLAGVVASALVLRPGVPFPGLAALLPVASTVAVLAGGAGGRTGGAGRLLSLPLPRYLGRISYSLYLWHWPVAVLGAALRPDRPAWLGPALLALSLALGAVSYALVEQPLRVARPAAPRLPRLALPLVLAGSLAVVLTSSGLTARAPDGVVASSAARPTLVRLPGGGTAQRPPADAYTSVPQLQAAVRAGLAREELGRLDPPLEDLERAAAPEWVADDCLDVFPEREDACVYGPPSATRDAVLLGDSVGISYLPGLRAALEPRGYRLHVLTRRQCALGAPDDAVSPGCRLHRTRVLDVTRRLAPDLVLVAGSYTVAARAVGVEDAPAWQRQLEGVLRSVRAPQRRVVVLAAPPQAGNLQSCATRVGSAQDCVRPVRPVWSAIGAAERAAGAAVGVRFVDTTGWFCWHGRCPATVDGTPVEVDGTHLTAAESRRLALVIRAAVS